jgi:hypothetical protein
MFTVAGSEVEELPPALTVTVIDSAPAGRPCVGTLKVEPLAPLTFWPLIAHW